MSFDVRAECAGRTADADPPTSSGSCRGSTNRARPLRLIRDAHPALAAQQAFTADCTRVMRRAQASGQRLATALYLVLTRHAPVPSYRPDQGLHLTCAECRSDGRAAAEQYPCPTARQAYWALDAVLR